MTVEFIKWQGKVTAVASPRNNLEAFREYVADQGLEEIPGMLMHAVDYRDKNPPMRLQVAYFEPGSFEINGGWINLGPVLIVNGAEQQTVKQETYNILNYMGETEDPESVNYHLARLRQHIKKD